MRVFERPPAVVGHRGAGERAVSGIQENTLASCRRAQADGATWVELDARRTADDALVLHHDGHLPDGRPVDEATLAECRAHGLECLDEVLSRLPPGLGVDLEIKESLADAAADDASSTAGRVARWADEVAEERPVLVTSFSASALLRAARVAPEVPRGLLDLPITSLRASVPDALHLGARVVAPHAVALGVATAGGLPVDSTDRIRAAVDVAHAHDLEVLAWGAAAAHVPGLVELGVDAICVDEVRATAAAGAVERRAG